MSAAPSSARASVEGLPLTLPAGAVLVAGSRTLPRSAWEGDHAWPHAADAIPVAAWDEDPFTMAVAAARALTFDNDVRGAIDKITIISSRRDFPAHLLPLALDLPLVAEEQIVVEYAPDWTVALDALTARSAKSGSDALLLAATTHGEVGPAVPALAAAVVTGHRAQPSQPRPAGPELDWKGFVNHSRVHSSDPTGGVAQGAFVSPEAWYANAAARLRLEGQRCEACDALVFPPRETCPACRGLQLAPHRFSGRGTVLSVTTIAQGGGPSEFDAQQEEAGPYAVAIVELAEGPRTVAMLTDCEPDEVDLGDDLEFVVRRIYVQNGLTRYGYKFRPVAP